MSRAKAIDSALGDLELASLALAQAPAPHVADARAHVKLAQDTLRYGMVAGVNPREKLREELEFVRERVALPAGASSHYALIDVLALVGLVILSVEDERGG